MQAQVQAQAQLQVQVQVQGTGSRGSAKRMDVQPNHSIYNVHLQHASEADDGLQ
jgi:hypothetical protein